MTLQQLRRDQQTIGLLMEVFQIKAKSHQKINSIADMKNFAENYSPVQEDIWEGV